jgi:hypothetical protein
MKSSLPKFFFNFFSSSDHFGFAGTRTCFIRP